MNLLFHSHAISYAVGDSYREGGSRLLCCIPCNRRDVCRTLLVVTKPSLFWVIRRLLGRRNTESSVSSLQDEWSCPHSEHRFPARKDVVNQCLEFGSCLLLFLLAAVEFGV